MDELLKKYDMGAKSLRVGTKVQGTIIRIDDDRVLVDIGGKAEGIVAEKAFKEATDFITTLKVGDKIDATVLVPETNEGYTILSFRSASADASWKRFEEAMKSGEELDVQVKSHANAGLTVDVLGVTGFIPSSQLGRETAKIAANLIGKTIKAVVLDLDRDKKRVILSEKEVSEKEALAKVRGALSSLTPGDLYDGEVTSIYDFGCFVRIEVQTGAGPTPLEGLVHISQMSWDKIDSPSSLVKVGDQIQVSILEVREGKLALSMKAAQQDPWETVDTKYSMDDQVSGTVSRITDYGIFVTLEPGIEGLLHITKLPPEKKLAVGDSVEVYIEEVDTKNRKIALGIVLTSKPLLYK